MNIKVKRLTETSILPTYGSKKAACMDLYADIPNGTMTSYPNSTVKIGTGLSFQPPKGYYGAIYARSGLATKQGLRPANCVGICDEDYTGEYIVAIYNDSEDIRYIHHGDRIAQLMFVPYEQATLEEVCELSKTERGSGGFGSTGTK